jgi:hypothetical protein
MNILFTKLIEFFFLINIILIWDRKRVRAGSRAEESENSIACHGEETCQVLSPDQEQTIPKVTVLLFTQKKKKKKSHGIAVVYPTPRSGFTM